MACCLFNICLSLFLQQRASASQKHGSVAAKTAASGIVIALDEAHKYMTASPEAATFTQTLLTTVRLQRHFAARIIVATQEPSIGTELLNLCSVTVVHRFTSPEWLRTLSKHLAGVYMVSRLEGNEAVAESSSFADDASACWVDGDREKRVNNGVKTMRLAGRRPELALLEQIVSLRIGEALLFAPSAVLSVAQGAHPRDETKIQRLGHDIIKMRTRLRITEDGGKSLMAE